MSEIKLSKHKQGAILWKKAVAGKKELPHGFRAEFVGKLMKALRVTRTTALTYTTHYSTRNGAIWDYQVAKQAKRAVPAKPKAARKAARKVTKPVARKPAPAQAAAQAAA